MTCTLFSKIVCIVSFVRWYDEIMNETKENTTLSCDFRLLLIYCLFVVSLASPQQTVVLRRVLKRRKRVVYLYIDCQRAGFLMRNSVKNLAKENAFYSVGVLYRTEM
jgi:hypothetical protein